MNLFIIECKYSAINVLDIERTMGSLRFRTGTMTADNYKHAIIARNITGKKRNT